jgi:DNA-binding NtrC family response regulator
MMSMGNRRGERAPPSRDEAYVVDADTGVLLLLGEVLERDGWSVRAFRNVRTARRALREHLPSLLIVDEDLPDGRGSELALEVRRDPAARRLPLLFCSAGGGARRAALSRLGPVVAKPIDIDQLTDLVHRAARSDGANAGLQPAGTARRLGS